MLDVMSRLRRLAFVPLTLQKMENKIQITYLFPVFRFIWERISIYFFPAEVV